MEHIYHNDRAVAGGRRTKQNRKAEKKKKKKWGFGLEHKHCISSEFQISPWKQCLGGCYKYGYYNAFQFPNILPDWIN